jgi:hypothetical protein
MAKLQLADLTGFIASRNLGTGDGLIILSNDMSLKIIAVAIRTMQWTLTFKN